MTRRLTTYVTALVAAASLFLAPHVAAAHGSDHGKHFKAHGHVHHGGHGKLRPHHHACRTIYRFGRHGVRKTIICDMPGHQSAPGLHLSAYQHEPQYRVEPGSNRHTVSPLRRGDFGPGAALVSSRQACGSKLVAGAVGGIAGAVLGSRIGAGSGRIAATAAGTTIRAIVGLGIADTLDRSCLAPASMTGR